MQQSTLVHDPAIAHLILDGSEGKNPMLLGQASIKKQYKKSPLPHEIIIITVFFKPRNIFHSAKNKKYLINYVYCF